MKTPDQKNQVKHNLTKAALPKRKNPRLKDFDYSLPYVYFLTICTRDKENVFCNHDLNSEIVNCLKQERIEKRIAIYAYCLMPDHLHLLISPLERGVNVSKFIGAFKSKTTKIAWKYELEGKLWQQRFYDHIVRKVESLKETCEYILNNPVRKGLVENRGDYEIRFICSFIRRDRARPCPEVNDKNSG